MRHRLPGNHLSRPYDQQRALLRSLATELLRHDEIITTLSKAKAVRSEAERIITLGKRATLSDPSIPQKAKEGHQESAKALANHIHCRRQINAYLYDKDVTKRVIDVVAPRYQTRQGGYTRIIRNGLRRGDAAPMAIIQLV